MLSESSIHWLAPVTIFSSLIGGACLALAHHLFNSSLKGTLVDAEPYRLASFETSQQQVNTAVGTALAFLSRSCLVVALSTAYVQTFWWTITRPCVRSRLSMIDILHSALDNLWNVFRIQAWCKHPILLLMALATWLIPIASIVTPATLSVVLAAVSPVPSSVRTVPMADFESLKFFAPGQASTFTGLASVNTVFYNGPTYMVERVAYSVAAGGSILPIKPPAPNASWTLDFDGPSLKCKAVNNTMREAIEINVLNAYRIGTGCQQPYNYLAWTAANGSPTPSEGIAVNENPFGNRVVPFTNSTPYHMNTGTLGPLLYDAAGAGGNATVNGTANATQVATIYFAAVPNFRYRETGSCNSSNATVEEIKQQYGKYFTNSTILECQLHNTSYHTEFDYVNGEQNVNITHPNVDQSVPVDTLAGFYMPPNPAVCAGLNIAYEGCYVDRYTLQRLSFQSIMDAFGRIFVGTVLDGQMSRYGGSYATDTKVMSTVLLDTAELSFLATPSNWAMAKQEGVYVHLGDAENMTSLYDWSGQQSSKRPLKEAIEELFQNITISMLSSEHFQPNFSSPFAPSIVNVTTPIYQNVYAYAEAKLWLAYGIAIGCTFLGVIAGLAAILANGACFSDDFSTILRVSRYADLSAQVRGVDAVGKDPLPEYLSDATVAFPQMGRNESGGVYAVSIGSSVKTVR